jgi:hypothetical protein
MQKRENKDLINSDIAKKNKARKIDFAILFPGVRQSSSILTKPSSDYQFARNSAINKFICDCISQ